MKILLLAAIYASVFFHFSARAQQFNVSWGDNSKATQGYGYPIQLNSGNYLMLRLENFKTTFSFAKNVTPDPILAMLDQDMRPGKETTFEIAEKNSVAWTLRKYGNNVFFTYNVYSDKQTSVYAMRLNQQTMLPEKRMILGVFDYDAFGIQPEIIYKLSADSSNVLLFAEGPPGANAGNKTIYIGLFDTHLKKMWSRYAELPISLRLVSVESQDITDDGKVFVAVKHYDKKILPNDVKDIEFKVPSYEYKLFVYSKEGAARQISFDLQNHFIEGTRLVFEKNGLVTAAGLYKKKHNGNITGAFYARFDSTTTIISKTQMLEFPPEILALVDKDGQGKSNGSDPGVSSLRIKDILLRSNGTVDLVSETQELRTTWEKDTKESFQRKEYRKHTYGDIININLDKGGRAIFTRIPKIQVTGQTDFALGYYPIVYGDKLVLLYNDHEDNMTRDLSKSPEGLPAARKLVLAAATIDAQGNVTRKAIYNFRDEKRLALPKFFSRMSDTKYFILSASGSVFSFRIGFGSLDIN